ncbi:hypothetical protein [Bradyrhizobium sp. WD16]|uniref:hypothetical protein n=1 Tax=Bradyrhizobium sp. WD16 TaxID=1521768 RepID=UPI0020A2DD6C|nr:hypothetical protein [Bradyrhizobium sp. WD16]UTD27781.1 hypothetical protein DB459_13530 [Bradyrhizobium sp. WD16]
MARQNTPRALYFRSRAAALLSDPDDWLDESVRYWLEKELKREPGYLYTDPEHRALKRVIRAGKQYDSWDGYSVPELIAASARYAGDMGEGEGVVNAWARTRPTRLRYAEMKELVGYARSAGVDVQRFEPPFDVDDD